MKDIILKNFLESTMMQYYFNNFEVLYVMMVGSKSFGMITEDSDFDIAIFVKEINNSIEHKHGQWLTDHHRLIHHKLTFDLLHPIESIPGSWFLDSIDTIESLSAVFLWWAMAWYRHTDDLVWINPKYQKAYNFLYYHKEFLLQYALHQEVKNMSSLLRGWYKDENITSLSNVYWKPIYRYLIAWAWFINKGHLKDEEYQFIQMIKNNSKFFNSSNYFEYQEVEKHIKNAISILQECIVFFDQLELPVKQYHKIKQEYKEIIYET